MLFLLKKLVAELLMPVPMVVGLLFVGVLLLWRRRAPRLTRACLTLGFLLLLVCGTWPVPTVLLAGLEQTYAVYHPTPEDVLQVRWIVVLGGGASNDPALPASGQLSHMSLARLVEGIRLLQLHPQARLLLSGGSVLGSATEAEVMQQTARLLGVDSTQIAVEPRSRDTDDQAVHIRAMTGAEPLVLVTSAFHMPRAMGLFRKQGLVPIPAPTDHLLKQHGFDPRDGYPSVDYLRRATLVAHEYLGIAWARLTGRL
jgi:uncharacterized SAM-binding protein YcdF (DUF218 family)